MLTTVILDGYLPSRLGCQRVWRLDLASPSPKEAVRALCALVKGFRRLMLEESEPGYHVLVGSRDLNAGQLGVLARPTEAITIMPPLTGAKNLPVLQLILGAVLITAGVVMLATGFGAPAAPYLISMGVSLTLAGVSGLLFKPPAPQAPREAPENTPNYVFDGPVNTMGQGNCVPLCYGQMRVGSQVISAAMDTTWSAGGGFGGGDPDVTVGPDGEPPSGGNCPVPSTPVLLADWRTLPAGDLKVGMLVRTMHEDTLAWGNYPVEAIVESEGECGSLALKNGRELTATLNHRVRLATGAWRELQDVVPGDCIVGFPSFSEVVAVSYVGMQRVVKVTVKDAHTYVTSGVLSHNIKKSPADREYETP